MSSPWLQCLQPWDVLQRPARGVAQALAGYWPQAAAGVSVPLSGGGLPVRPVPAVADLNALAYERHIADTGELPTRDNAHDWYNALVWLAFPHTRRIINSLQLADADADASVLGANGRTRRRDALTLLDENGAVLVTADAAMADALVRHDWHSLFVARRADWPAMAQVWVMGHALFEKLEAPRLDLCAHVRVWVMGAGPWQSWSSQPFDVKRQAVDAWLAADIQLGLQRPGDLRPLPLMGIPGWHAGNADSAFYNNSAVFRPPRPHRASS